MEKPGRPAAPARPDAELAQQILSARISIPPGTRSADRGSAPDENVTTKGDWHEYLASFVPMLTGAPEHTRMTDRGRVALWYFPQTEVTTTTLASELFTVRDGKIVEIRLAFDRLGYIPGDQQPS